MKPSRTIPAGMQAASQKTPSQVDGDIMESDFSLPAPLAWQQQNGQTPGQTPQSCCLRVS